MNEEAGVEEFSYVLQEWCEQITEIQGLKKCVEHDRTVPKHNLSDNHVILASGFHASFTDVHNSWRRCLIGIPKHPHSETKKSHSPPSARHSPLSTLEVLPSVCYPEVNSSTDHHNFLSVSAGLCFRKKDEHYMKQGQNWKQNKRQASKLELEQLKLTATISQLLTNMNDEPDSKDGYISVRHGFQGYTWKTR
uniref:Uncharacterized protein n=1 Tax=Tanacetum cinerariifolium TaxID=118510 RepID=A0A6L2LN02_TANCI|nr:hypothetical protein CTI12_AA075300 [Tanacetum cinerariifolium]